MTFYVGHKQLSAAEEADPENESGIVRGIGPGIPEGTEIGIGAGRGRGRGYAIGTETEEKEEDIEDNALRNCSHLKQRLVYLCVYR